MRMLTTILVLLCGFAYAPPASAQTPAQGPRPYRGLFGSGSGNTDQLLALTLSFVGGFDTGVQTSVPSPDGSLGSAIQSVRSNFEQAMVGLNYRMKVD